MLLVCVAAVVEVRTTPPALRGILETPSAKQVKSVRVSKKLADDAGRWCAAQGYVAGPPTVETRVVVTAPLLPSGGVVTDGWTRPSTLERRLGLRRNKPFRWHNDRWRRVVADFYEDATARAEVVDGAVVVHVTGKDKAFRFVEPNVDLSERGVRWDLRCWDANVLGLGLAAELDVASDTNLTVKLRDRGWELSNKKLALGSRDHPRRFVRGRATTLFVQPKVVELATSRATSRTYVASKVSAGTDFARASLVAAVERARLRCVAFAAVAAPKVPHRLALKSPLRRDFGVTADTSIVGVSAQAGLGQHALVFADATSVDSRRRSLKVACGLAAYVGLFRVELVFSGEGGTRRPVVAFRIHDPQALPPPP